MDASMPNVKPPLAVRRTSNAGSTPERPDPPPPVRPIKQGDDVQGTHKASTTDKPGKTSTGNLFNKLPWRLLTEDTAGGGNREGGFRKGRYACQRTIHATKKCILVNICYEVSVNQHNLGKVMNEMSHVPFTKV